MSEKLYIALRVNRLDKEDADRRQKRRDKLRAQAELREKEAKDAAFQRTWGWKGEGEKTLFNFKDRFRKVKNILEPHEFKKKNVKELNRYFKRAKLHKENPVSTRTLFRSAKLLARASLANSKVKALRSLAPANTERDEVSRALSDIILRVEVADIVDDILIKVALEEYPTIRVADDEVTKELYAYATVKESADSSNLASNSFIRNFDSRAKNAVHRKRSPDKTEESDRDIGFVDAQYTQPSSDKTEESSREVAFVNAQYTEPSPDNTEESDRDIGFVDAQYTQPSSDKTEESSREVAFVNAQYTEPSADKTEESDRDIGFVDAQYTQSSTDKTEESNREVAFVNAQYTEPSAEKTEESDREVAFVDAQYNELSADKTEESDRDIGFVDAQYTQPSTDKTEQSDREVAFVDAQYNELSADKTEESDRDIGFVDAQYTQLSTDKTEESDREVAFVDAQYNELSADKTEISELEGTFNNAQYRLSVADKTEESDRESGFSKVRDKEPSSAKIAETNRESDVQFEQPLAIIAGQSSIVEGDVNKVQLAGDLPDCDDITNYRVGDRVAGNYGGYGHWYPAVVVSCSVNNTYDIAYDDGDFESDVLATALRSLTDDYSQHGERNDENISASINSHTQDNKTRWDDALEGLPCKRGEENSIIEHDKDASGEVDVEIPDPNSLHVVLPLHEKVNLFMPGDRILCNYANQGQWCPGIISASKADGFYDINYFDGDTENDKEERSIIEYPQQNSSLHNADFCIGTKILCNFQSRGIWFEGVVKLYKKTHTMGEYTSFDIQYSDGDLEFNVLPKNVIPRPMDDSSENDEPMSSEPMLLIHGSSFVPRESNHLEGKLFKKMSQRIINAVKPFHERTKQKNQVVHLKLIVMRQLYKTAHLKELSCHPDQPFVPPMFEHDAIEPMKLAFARRIPLSPIKVMMLKMMRSRLEDARQLYQRTLNGIEKCKFMAECQSIFHYKLSGCPKCGVVFVSDVMHVHTFDRATLTPIVSTREFEMQVIYPQ